MSASAPSEGKAAVRVRRAVVAGVAAVVVVAVVLAVLLPVRGDYADRAQVAEALAMLTAARVPLVEHYANHGEWPPYSGGAPQSAVVRYTQSIAVTRGGGRSPELELTATLNTTGVDRRVAGRTVRMFTADGGKTWACGGGTVPERTLPAACRAGP